MNLTNTNLENLTLAELQVEFDKTEKRAKTLRENATRYERIEVGGSGYEYTEQYHKMMKEANELDEHLYVLDDLIDKKMNIGE